MLTIIENGVYLRCEKKSFGKGDTTITYGEIKFIDGNDEVVKATMNEGMFDEIEKEGLPDRLDEVRIELEVTEEDGRKGKYLKKRLISIR